MDIKVVSSVAIKITQEDMEQMIIDKIADHDANITVDSLEFVQRRNPTRMDVDVKAHYGKDAPVVQLTAPVMEPEAASEDEPEEAPQEEKATVGDIFGD